jgi:hypothetical protein
VDHSGGAVRVEPLADTPLPAWDLLVGSGRLDALSIDDARRLTEAKWFDELLGLAGAYAVYAAGAWDYLDIVLRNLRERVGLDAIDGELLRLAMGQRTGTAAWSDDDLSRLSTAAQDGEIPLFRWGVPLAVRLIDDAAPTLPPLLKGWRQALGHIELKLSPVSVWTAWIE